jgi:tetratricopeptide (TPR) repeat protein
VQNPKIAAATLAILAALAAPGRAAEAPPLDVPGFEALSSAAEARGDTDAFLALLAGIVEKAPASPAARLALARLAAVGTDTTERATAVRAALEKAAAGPIGDAENRAEIFGMLAVLYEKAGDWEHARVAMRECGFVRDWLVIGPFGFSRRALHDRVFAVEIAARARAMDVNEAFDGSAGKVHWRKAALGPLQPNLDPSERIQPARGAAYGLAQVRAPAGSKALLTVRCSGSFKVFWNGALAADFDRSEAYLAHGVTFPVTFAEGWNRLLVKDSNAHASFSARLAAADGSGPVAGLEVAPADRIEPLGEGPPPGEPLEAVRTAASGPVSAWLLAQNAVLLQEAGLAAEALPLFQAAVEAEPHSPHLRALYAHALESAEHLPAVRRKNDARRLFEEALAEDPKFLPALLARALFLDQDGKPDEAVKALRALGKDFPGSAEPRLAAAAICRKQGWDAEEIAEIRAAAGIEPHGARSALRLAEFYEKRSPTRALEAFRAALALDRSLSWVEDRVASLLVHAGDAAAALEIRKGLAERYPGEIARLRALAETLRAQGDLAATARVYRQSADLRGGAPDDLERAGEALLEAGDRAGALETLREALAAAPGRYGLRRMIGRLGGEDADFAKEFDIDGKELIAQAPPQEKFPKASSICLLDHTVTRIFHDGSQVDYVHQMFKIYDQHAADRYHALNLPGEVLEARTIAASGEVYEPIITDNSAEILMPELNPGAVIEYRYRAVKAGPPEFQFDSGTFFFKDPQMEEPLCLSRYVVIADKGLDFARIQRNFPEPPVVEDRGDRVVYQWERRDSDRIDEEPLMPEKEELLPLVELVQRRSWDDVHEILRERTLGRTRLTPELRSKAAEVAGRAEGDAARARRLYDFVLDHVKTEQGGGGDASEILSAHAGSRVVLLKALLDAAGVPSRWAVASENPALAPEQVWDPPRPELLNGGMLLLVEPRDGPAVWVTDGGRFLPYGLVPTTLQNGTALLLGKQGGEFRVVPAGPVDESRVEGRVRIALDGRAATIESDEVFHDAGAYQFKERVATAPKAQLRNLVEQQAAHLYLGAKVRSFDFPHVGEPGVPFEIAATVEAPSFVEDRDGTPSVKMGLAPLELTQSFGGKPVRDTPMMLRMVRAVHETSEIALGPGYEVSSVPPNLLLQEKFASYSLTFSIEKGKVRVVRAFHVLPSKLEPREYPTLLKFVREVDAAEAKRVQLRAVAQ